MREGLTGVGCDLCAVDRMARAMEKAHFYERVFLEQERSLVYLQLFCWQFFWDLT